MNETILRRGLTLLSLVLFMRRRRRTLKRGVFVLKRVAFVLAVAAAVAAAVVWSKRKRGQVEEVPTGQRPIEGVGTQTTG